MNYMKNIVFYIYPIDFLYRRTPIEQIMQETGLTKSEINNL